MPSQKKARSSFALSQEQRSISRPSERPNPKTKINKNKTSRKKNKFSNFYTINFNS